jgi:hypothetical protein
MGNWLFIGLFVLWTAAVVKACFEDPVGKQQVGDWDPDQTL